MATAPRPRVHKVIPNCAPASMRDSSRLPRTAATAARLPEGVFTPEQKQDIVRKLTDTTVGIDGENMRP